MNSEAAVQRPIPKAPGFLTSSLRVFDLSLGEMLWSRRTIFMALVVGAPVVISLFLRLLDALGAPVFRVNGVSMPGPTIFGLMIWVFYLRFTVPVLGVFYGTSLIADEVEDKTITYLFTRPIPKGAVLVGKYFAYLACTLFVVLPSVVIVYLCIVPLRGSLGGSFPDLLKDLALLAIGLAVYGSVFAFIDRSQRSLAKCLERFRRGGNGLVDALKDAPIAVDVACRGLRFCVLPQCGKDLFDDLANGVWSGGGHGV